MAAYRDTGESQDPGLSFMSHDRFVGVSVPICRSIPTVSSTAADAHRVRDHGGRAGRP